MDLDRDAKRLLDLATEARTPVAADKARVEERLAAMLGASALAASSAVAGEAAQQASAALTGAKAAGSGALKWWIASALVASAVTGYVALSGRAPAPATKPAPRAAAPIAAPEPIPEPAHVATPAMAAADLPEPERPARALAPKKHADGSNLGDELELLHRAQAAWRAHDARQALSLIDEHRARFPRSDLRLERDGLRVLTLCELGRKSEASALAKKLLERAPRSPLRGTIEESCALK